MQAPLFIPTQVGHPFESVTVGGRALQVASADDSLSVLYSGAAEEGLAAQGSVKSVERQGEQQTESGKPNP